MPYKDIWGHLLSPSFTWINPTSSQESPSSSMKMGSFNKEQVWAFIQNKNREGGNELYTFFFFSFKYIILDTKISSLTIKPPPEFPYQPDFLTGKARWNQGREWTGFQQVHTVSLSYPTRVRSWQRRGPLSPHQLVHSCLTGCTTKGTAKRLHLPSPGQCFCY